MKHSIVIIFCLYAFNVFSDEKEEIKPYPEGCSSAYESTQLIIQSKWNEIISKIQFPIELNFPLSNLSKKQYINNPKLVFENDMFGDSIHIQKKNNSCMINKGLIWHETDTQGGKIKKINFKSSALIEKRKQISFKITKLLPEKYQTFDVNAHCTTGKSVYTVINNKNDYILFKQVKNKITDIVADGKMRIDPQLGARYFRFLQDNTQFTLSESKSSNGYNIEARNGKKVIFVKCDYLKL